MATILHLKKISHHNPLEVLCIPTCIKNIMDNQFNIIPIRRHLLNKWCRFDGNLQDIMGIDALEEHFAPKLRKNRNINYVEKNPGKINDLTNLLNAKIFPVIVFKIEDYNRWKKSSIVVEQAGSTTYHAMIVCGFDSSKEIIYLYDPIYDRYNQKKYKSTNPLDLYDEISFLDFTRCWDRGFNSFMFWFEDTASTKRKRKTHKTLDKF